MRNTSFMTAALLTAIFSVAALAYANTPPVADAGENHKGTIGEQVILDGSASYDPDGSTLHYYWLLISKPQFSVAPLQVDSASPYAAFIPDLPGEYIFRLVVSDGTTYSDPDVSHVSANGDCRNISEETIQQILASSTDPWNKAAEGKLRAALKKACEQ